MIDINSILDDRKKAWSIAASVVLCVLAFILLFQHDFGSFRKTELAIVESRQNKATLDSVGEYKKYLKEFNIYLAPGNGTDWFMETLTTMSKDKDITLSAVKPLETEHSTGYGIVKVSIEGVSSYKKLLRFIEALEDNKEHMLIEDISMKAIETDTGWSAKGSSAVPGENRPRDRSVSFKATIASVVREI